MERQNEKVFRESTPSVHRKCEICKSKQAVVIENKKYYCGVCLCLKKGINPQGKN